MAQRVAQVPHRVVQVARLIRGLSPGEREQLKVLVPDLQRLPETKLMIDKGGLRDYIQQELAKVEDEYPSLMEADPFLGGLTVGEYFALPDEDRERIWNEEHTMEIEDFEEHDVKPNAYVPVLEGLQEEKEAHRARMEDWLAEARALRQKILERREGSPLPDSVEMLRELREERDEQILGDPLQSSSGL